MINQKGECFRNWSEEVQYGKKIQFEKADFPFIYFNLLNRIFYLQNLEKRLTALILLNCDNAFQEANEKVLNIQDSFL